MPVWKVPIGLMFIQISPDNKCNFLSCVNDWTELDKQCMCPFFLKVNITKLVCIFVKLVSLSLIFRNIFCWSSCNDCICEKWTNLHIFVGNLEWWVSEEACNVPLPHKTSFQEMLAWVNGSRSLASPAQVIEWYHCLIFLFKRPDRSWPQSKYWRAADYGYL